VPKNKVKCQLTPNNATERQCINPTSPPQYICFQACIKQEIINQLMHLIMEKQRKKLLLSGFVLLSVSGVFAQGNGTAGINEATQMVTSYFDPATKLIYAIGAVVGLIGGVKVYNKFSSGDPDTSKTAASWFGACIFLIVAATILRSFFL
jgi:hypothetical protein